MKTISAKKSDVKRKWFMVDADDKVLGRMASRIASVLRGKHKAVYTPHVDTGDFVVVVNASKVKLTGKKETDKIYHHHTGWVGGIVSKSAAELREKTPDRLVKKAVKGMLPNGPLGREMLRKLKVYGDADHPHEAQKPETLAI
jgi:large subunit ribosomal protein L13